MLTLSRKQGPWYTMSTLIQEVTHIIWIFAVIFIIFLNDFVMFTQVLCRAYEGFFFVCGSYEDLCATENSNVQ